MDNFDTFDDEELIKLVQQANHAAFNALFKRYHKRVMSAAYAILKNQEDAFEISQEAFVRVYQNISKYQQGTHFYTWLYQITKNLAIDRYRKKRTAQEVEFDTDYQKNFALPEEIVPPSLHANPEKSYQRAEMRDHITKALNALSEKHREIIILCEFNGLQYNEIAQLLNIPIGTVMSRLFTARQKLQTALKEYSNPDGGNNNINNEDKKES